MKHLKRPIHFFLFLALLVATYFNYSWPWGLLFLFWTLRSLHYREAYFLDTVRCDEEPVFYWLIVLTWLVLAVLMILMSIPALYPFFYPEYY